MRNFCLSKIRVQHVHRVQHASAYLHAIHQRKFTVIAAMTRDGGIGYKHTIPWHIPLDLKWFKKITCREISIDKNEFLSVNQETPNKFGPNKFDSNKFAMSDHYDFISALQSKSRLFNENRQSNLIVGSTTYNHLTSPLQHRNLFVLTRKSITPPLISPSSSKSNPGSNVKQQQQKERLFSINSWNEAMQWHLFANEINVPTFVIGGAQIYNMALNDPRCTRVLITSITSPEKIPVDTYFPKQKLLNDFVLVDRSQEFKNGTNNKLKFEFQIWKPKFISSTKITTSRNLQRQSSIPIKIQNRQYHTTLWRRNPEETHYLNLLKKVITHGSRQNDRTGVGTRTLFGNNTMSFNLGDDNFPLLTTKQMSFHSIKEELLWILRGSTNAVELKEKRVKIWDGNTSRKNLDRHGFQDWPEGEIGKGYGHLFRSFGGTHPIVDKLQTRSNTGVDQLATVIDSLQRNPDSRRHIISLWDPTTLDKTILPPCHMTYQFFVNPDTRKLDLQMYQRSGDIFLGIPYNIASASLFLKLMAHKCNFSVGTFHHCISHLHLYDNHLDSAKEQLQRNTFPWPQLTLSVSIEQSNIQHSQVSSRTNTRDFFNDYKFKLSNYQSHPKIQAPMAV